MKNLKIIIVVIFSFLITNSCKKTENINSSETPINDIETVTASVVGIVVNENDVPVQGAIVNLGSNTVTTDMYGMFRFNSKAISKNNTHIKVVKSGYFNGNRSMLATAGRTHNVRIKLIPKTITGNFVATTGGSVSLSTGGKVTIPANAIVDATGNAYSGTVNVAMAWINPTSNDLASTIQGDLRGVTTQGYERVLETYGMLSVELTTPNGQELKITTGKTAELTTPIPTALQATAPSSIPLWHFDETKGRWIEEGNANKIGNNYVGSVKHFSFWNYDVALNSISLCVNLVNSNNIPLNNVMIKIRRSGVIGSSCYAQTDSLGNCCMNVAKNETLVLDVLDLCGNSIFSQNIGPFSTNSSLNFVCNIPSSSVFNFSGNLNNCSASLVTKGSVLLYTTGGIYYNAPVVNGSFNFPILLNCNNTSFYYTLIATDSLTGISKITSGVTTNNITNLGTITVCNNALPSQYVYYTVDGILRSWSVPNDGYIINQSLTNTNLNYAGKHRIVADNGFNPSNPIAFEKCQFDFFHNNSVGTYPISSFSATTLSFGQSGVFVTSNPQVTITQFDPVPNGGNFSYLKGSFNFQALFGNVIRNVSCNFQVKL